MLPYWILFAVFALGSLDYRRRAGARENEPLPILALAAILTAAMIGFRFEVGGDWQTYLMILEHSGYLDFGSSLTASDPGYSLINWLATRMGLGIWAVNLFCGAAFTWGLFRFARFQANPWLAFLVAVPYLIIVVAMGYTRQAVAIGIIMAGLVNLRDMPSMVRFGIYVLVAATFHKSAIIVLPLVAFAATRNKLVMVGIGIVMGLMLYYLFVATAIDRLVENYVVQDYDSQGALVRVAMNLPPALIYLTMRKRFAFPTFDAKLWRNFSFAAFGALVILMLLESSTVVDRLALYLIPLQLVIFSHLPSLFNRSGRQNGQLTILILAYSALVQFVWLTSAAHADYWLPYQLYFL